MKLLKAKNGKIIKSATGKVFSTRSRGLSLTVNGGSIDPLPVSYNLTLTVNGGQIQII